jgi:hypothetical protein
MAEVGSDMHAVLKITRKLRAEAGHVGREAAQQSRRAGLQVPWRHDLGDAGLSSPTALGAPHELHDTLKSSTPRRSASSAPISDSELAVTTPDKVARWQTDERCTRSVLSRGEDLYRQINGN